MGPVSFRKHLQDRVTERERPEGLVHQHHHRKQSRLFPAPRLRDKQRRETKYVIVRRSNPGN